MKFLERIFHDSRNLWHYAQMLYRLSHRSRLTKTLISFAAVIGLITLFQNAHAAETKTLELHSNDAGRPLTDVSINGTPTSALLDTGATIALIDHDFFGDDTAPEIGVEETLILGVGGHRFYPTARLENLRIDSHSWSDLNVAVNAERRFPIEQSVLPISLFEESVVDFDFKNNQVLLYDGRPKRTGRQTPPRMRYSEIQKLIFVEIEINGARGKALIDTGAQVSFVNPQFAERSNAKPSVEDTKRVRGSDLSNQIASIYKFKEFEIGDYEIARFKLLVLDTDLFDQLGFGDGPMMVLGMDVLKHSRLQIDRKRQRISISFPDIDSNQAIDTRSAGSRYGNFSRN